MTGQQQLILALDAMGGDHAPNSVLEGAEIALTRFPNLHYLLYGDQQIIAPALEKLGKLKAASTIMHTTGRVEADDKPSRALKQAKDSSMRLAIDAVGEGKAAGVVSAGNTGALMAMAKFVLRTLPGISRPAIAGLFPTVNGECVVLDLGANVECSALDLFQFAIMGDAFARAVLGLDTPRIGVLNVGAEEVKGHEDVKMAAAMLKASGLKFHGFVEGNDITAGTVDVVVTDGFTGNIALKTAEGVAKMFGMYLKETFASSLRSKMGYLLARPALMHFKESLDPRKRNGAMFLGLNGIAVKSHGGADAWSFAHAIGVAADLITHQVNTRIIAEVSRFTPPKSEAASGL